MKTNLLRFQAGGLTLDVRSFEVHKGIDQPFLARLVGASLDPDLDLDAPIGAEAIFAVDLGGGSRAYTGIVRRLDLVASEPDGLSTYLVEIVPLLAALADTTGYRAYQDASELDVALSVLARWGIVADVRVDRARYKRREIRVQYGESDLAFFARLLEEIGVAYWFEHTDATSRLVLGDAPHTAAPRRIAYREIWGGQERASVTAVQIDRRLRPGRYTIRDRDFRKAWDQAIEATFVPGADVSPLEAQLERYHYVPGGFLHGSDEGETPTADDRIAARTDMDVGFERAERRLLAKRGDALTVSFASYDLGVAPAQTLAILDHPGAALGDANPLLVCTTVFSGRHDQLAPIACTARSAKVAYHPTLSTARPRVSGFETATVVGPKGEEIHTDEFGRVRVHFHWDRDDDHDERSSCWLHASQPWAGRGYGGVNLPRGGQEVLVEFVAADPDRPLIVGRVFTDLQKVPYKLPDNKTQSGWKSSSTGGGGGFNEIMFEDSGGQELVRMRAQRDLDTKVKRNEDRTVRNDRRTSVSRHDARKVGRHQTQTIEGSSTKTVKGTSDSFVKDAATKYVQGPVRTSVAQLSSSFTGGSSDTQNGTFRDTSAEAVVQVSAASHTLTGGDAKVVISTEQIRWELGTTTLEVKPTSVVFSAVDMEVNCRRLAMSAPDVTFGGGDLELHAFGKAAINGNLVALNGPSKPAARIGEPAPDKVRNGAAAVQIGGPSLPADATVNEDGSITVGGNVVIKGDAKFQAKTLADLTNMRFTKRGRALLKSLMDPNQPGTIEISDSTYQGGKVEPGLWGKIFGGKSDAYVDYDPRETQGEVPGDGLLYDHLRQADRLRKGQGKDPNWMDEEREYLRERNWGQYRSDDSGEYQKF